MERLKILIVDDSPMDAELALSELARAGINFTARRVDSEPALRSELGIFRPDIVLSDFTMPAFDGFAAVSIVLREAPGTPCIFVSGTLGEDRAVEALHRGGTDYVLKTNLSRLPPAVLRAVRDARQNAAREKADSELQVLRERLENIAGTVPDVLWSIAWPSREILYASPAFSTVFGFPVEELHGSITSLAALLHAEDPSRLFDACERAPKDEPFEVECRIVRPDGEPRWIQHRARHARDAAGTVVRIDGVSRDITERQEQRAKIAYLSNYDSLTGLPNRDLFRERIAQLLQSARRSGKRIAIAVGDIRRFRQVNETLGAAAGDSVLRECAQRLQRVWPEPETVARLGGASFAGAITQTGDPAAVIHTLDKTIRDAFQRPFLAAGQELHIHITSGIAVFPTDGEDVETLLTNAEAALLRAKASRERFLFYQPEMNAHVAQLLTLETKLQRAIELDHFVLHYQPKISTHTGRVTGLEALIRWQDPALGLVPPAQFIRILEDTGLILEVGRWAIRTALSESSPWRSPDGEPLRIAVNVSAIQLQQRDFVDAVSDAVRDLGGEQHRLDLEITESLIMRDIGENIGKLTALSSMGVRLAIDDFGTGYSSLAYLAQLPVHALKIDRSFVDTMARSTQSATIVGTIISLAHSLGFKVTAEGVETSEQERLLRLMGCDELQGYLYSRPLPPGQIAEFLRTHTDRVLACK